MTTPDQPTGMNELREIIIEALDNYHDGGEFHEYTPLEKQRHADGLIQEFQQIVARCIPAKLGSSLGESDSDYFFGYGNDKAIDLFRHNLQQAGLLRGAELTQKPAEETEGQ